MGAPEDQAQPVKAQLGMWDAVSIIIGIVIGSSIYVTPPIIMGKLPDPWTTLGMWAVGGFLSVVGALCYAELATTYPRMGGDYVYLNRAFGHWCGFLFGWAQIAVILTSSVGMMGFVFGTYAMKLVPTEGLTPEQVDARNSVYSVYLALGAVGLLALLNVLGVILGKFTQNVLSLLKVVGLGGIAIAGLAYGQSTSPPWEVVPDPGRVVDYSTALILILYAYGGWNDAAFVAADMRERTKIPAALIVGTTLITAVYVLVNVAYIHGLGWTKASQFTPTIAADVLKGPLGENGAKAMSVLVMISALGAINGLIFTGSRVCTALGSEHRVFALLGRWHPTLGSPLWSLLVLALVAMAMIAAVGTETGRNTIDQALTAVSLPALPWAKYYGGFDTLFAGTAPVFWTFFLLTGISVFVLRVKDRDIERPFRVPLYPITPLIFCAMCLFGIYAALKYAEWLAIIGIVPLAIGVPLYLLSGDAPRADVTGE